MRRENRKKIIDAVAASLILRSYLDYRRIKVKTGIKNEFKYKYVLFCENIRQEIGGKVSLMGVLGSKLLTQQSPIGFPNFAFSSNGKT